LATEVASAWVSHSVRRLGLKDLMAFSHPENLASVRVLAKTGFVFSHSQRLMDMEAEVYRLPNDNFSSASDAD
jgi:RimJ/RimL family protein N-acetyltransferase